MEEHCFKSTLEKTDLVLFLNKCDILRAKLESGIRLSDYIVSYGDRPNDFESASTCSSSFALSLLAVDHVDRLEEKVCRLDEGACGR